MSLFDSLITFLQGDGRLLPIMADGRDVGHCHFPPVSGVAKQYEPLLMVPIAFGALIANIPDNGMLITS